MSVSGAMLAGFRSSLRSLMLTGRCTRASAASNWTDAAGCHCLVEEATIAPGSPLDAEIGNGYGYTVYLPHNQAMEVTDRILCQLGTLEVVRVTPIGTMDGTRRADCVWRAS